MLCAGRIKVLFGNVAVYTFVPVPVVARSKELVCSRSLVGLTASNPAGVIDICPL